MITGIGIDMIEAARIEKACKKEHFVQKCYTLREIELFKGNPASMAGNFVVKEAVAKALGTGFRGFGLQDIEVLRDELGKPYVQLYNGAMHLAAQQQVVQIIVSITNLKEYVSAVAVAEGKDIHGIYGECQSGKEDR